MNGSRIHMNSITNYSIHIQNKQWTRERHKELFDFLDFIFDQELNPETKLHNPSSYIKTLEELSLDDILRENIDNISAKCFRLERSI
jgi:hypothetical protein